MPERNPPTESLQCPSCGRNFATEDAIRLHAPDCMDNKPLASPERKIDDGYRDESNEDQDNWTTTT